LLAASYFATKIPPRCKGGGFGGASVSTNMGQYAFMIQFYGKRDAFWCLAWENKHDSEKRNLQGLLMTWLALLYQENKRQTLNLKQGKISAILSGMASESRVFCSRAVPPTSNSSSRTKY